MSNDTQVWLNGEFIPWSSATVPILSHSFSRASAIFEIFRIHMGPNGPSAFRMSDHLERLFNSAGFLEMELCYSPKDISMAVAEAVKRNNIDEGVIKIMAYWGEEAVIRLIPEASSDLAIFAIPAIPDMQLDSQASVTTCLSKWRKIDPQTVPVSAKACSNYLNAYLARKDAVSRGFDVGIMLGTDGMLAEGSAESVFIVKDNILQVPPLGRVLPSISRASVLEMARTSGTEIEEKPLELSDLIEADEIFLSHTGVKVAPVRKIEDRLLDVPGPLTRKLMQRMASILKFEDELAVKWMQPL